MIEWAAQHGLEWLVNDGTIPGIISLHPVQMVVYTLVVFALGYLVGKLVHGGDRPRGKSARQLRREMELKEEAESRRREEERRRKLNAKRDMVERIAHMPHSRMGIMLTALRDGRVSVASSDEADAMTLHGEGYLNIAGLDSSHRKIFTVPSKFTDFIETDDEARESIERAIAVYESERSDR